MAADVDVAIFTMRWAVRFWTPGRISFILRRSLCRAGTGDALSVWKNLNARLLTLLMMAEL